MSWFKRHPKLTSCFVGLLALVLIALVVARIYLGVWLLDYVNDVLQHIDGYQGSVESIDIDLYRGAYRIHKLVLNKKEGTIPAPFVSIGLADLSLQWSALFHGRIVSSVTLIRPVVNFAVNESVRQIGTEVDWTKPIKDLAPIDINLVTFKDGTVTYQDFASTPQVNIYIRNIEGTVGNLRNVVNPADPLPSMLHISGDSIGGGRLDIKGKLNILKEVPDMNLLTQLENVNLPAINNYSEAYGAFDFKNGNFDLYSQLVVKDSQVSGYVKLLLSNISVDLLKTANPLQIAWETVVAGVIKVFTNPTKDQFATKADLEGDLKDINANIWTALGSMTRNAFVAALKKGLDDTGDNEPMQDSK
jgi:hypothetical protein